MPGLNFMERFAAAVESGEKRQTIRKVRVYPIEVGDTLMLWTGQRRPGARKIGEHVCTEVLPIRVEPGSMEIHVILDGVPILTAEGLWEFAQRDGFNRGRKGSLPRIQARNVDIDEFRGFFESRYGLPFEGVVIRW